MSNNNDLNPIRRFRRLIKVDNKDISQVYVYALFTGLVNLSLPVGIQAIINLIQGGEISTAWVVLVSFVIAGIVATGFFQLLQLRIVENLAQKLFARASFEFAFRIPRIKSSELKNYYAPELANRFFDTLTIQKGLPKILMDFSLAAFQILVGLIVLGLYHPFFIIFGIFLLVLIYSIFAFTGPRGMKSSLEESKYKYKMAHWLEEIARTKLSFKLVSDQDISLSNTNMFVDGYITSREKHFKILLLQFVHLIGFKLLVAAGLLITGSILVFNQEMNIGQFVAAEIIIILIINSVEKLIVSLDTIYDVLTALEKIGVVTDMVLDEEKGLMLDETDIKDGVSLHMHDVHFQFTDGDREILKGVEFILPAGKSMVIKGPNGAGKSTLLHLLAGIYDPTSGVIEYNGLALSSLQKDCLRKNIGFCLSDNHIFLGSVRENIDMGRNISIHDIMNVVELVNLDEFFKNLPYGLETHLDPEGKKLPESVRNKILLARAVVSKPLLIVMENLLEHLHTEEKRTIIKRLIYGSHKISIVVAANCEAWEEFIPNSIVLENGIVSHSTIQ
jgi:ABC-type bacteriocin/lantibiotic exporter with double-glycine peptidase domain